MSEAKPAYGIAAVQCQPVTRVRRVHYDDCDLTGVMCRSGQCTCTATADVQRLRDALDHAIEEVEGWGTYASDYFQQKWDLRGTVDRLRSVLDAASSNGGQGG